MVYVLHKESLQFFGLWSRVVSDEKQFIMACKGIPKNLVQKTFTEISQWKSCECLFCISDFDHTKPKVTLSTVQAKV